MLVVVVVVVLRAPHNTHPLRAIGMHVAGCKCGKCWPGSRFPHLNGLHCGVAEGFFPGPAPVPESMVLGLKLACWTTPPTHSSLPLMEVWSESVRWGLNWCLGARSNRTFSSNSTGKKLLNRRWSDSMKTLQIPCMLPRRF